MDRTELIVMDEEMPLKILLLTYLIYLVSNEEKWGSLAMERNCSFRDNPLTLED